MAAQKILVPYNFSSQDEAAIAFVTRMFAHEPDTEVILFHAYTPLPKVTTEKSTVMEKMNQSMTYLMQQIKAQEAELEAVKNRMVAGGLAEGKIQLQFSPRGKDVASEICQQAREHDCHMVILNRKSGKVSRFFTGSVYRTVVPAMKGRTVVVVC